MRFSYAEPTTLGEAVSIMADLRKQGIKARYLAGGTDLIPGVKQGITEVHTIVNLKFIEGMNSIVEDDTCLRVGSLAKLCDIAKSEVVRKWSPAVAEAAGKVASPGIRNMGTIGGNILQTRRCWYYNQSRAFHYAWEPCYATGGKVCYKESESKACRRVLMSDLVPALMVAGAKVELVGVSGKREVLLESLVNSDTGVVNIPVTEVISEVKIPKNEFKKENYVRMSVRRTIDYPEISVAVGLETDSNDNSYKNIQVVVGSVCPGPFRSKAAGTISQSGISLSDLGTKLGEVVAEEITEKATGTHNFSKWYKLEMIKVVVAEAFEALN